MGWYRVVAAAAAVVGFAVFTPWAVRARAGASDEVESFYRGKTVTIVVGFSAGGGYDLYARTLARHMGRHVPGNPTVIVQNMPGAGSLTAANHLFNAAPKDGTVFGIFSNALVIEQLVGSPEARFDQTRFNWIGSMNAEAYICVARVDSGVKRFDDLFAASLRVGASGPRAETSAHPRFLNGLLNTRFEVIEGYPGSNEIDLAIERGEVEGRCGYAWSSASTRKPEWFNRERPFVNILVQMGRRKHPDLANVPMITEFAPDARVRRLLDSVFSPLGMARSFAAPPGVPAERVAALRRAFEQALQDPQLRAEARQIRLELNAPLSGQEVQQLVHDVLNIPREDAVEVARYLR